jgi:predicted RNA-binding protein associated with RNAse of E/G family
MTSSVTVHKLNENGQEVWRYRGEVLERTYNSITLRAHFDHDDLDLHQLQIRRGDRFIETFYSDRWYNIFAIYDVDDDHHKGWYCNIARPARLEPQDVYADDLALDLIVTPEREFAVLDEDEFEALEISPEDRRQALDTLGELKAMAANSSGPFDLPTSTLRT